MLSRFFAAWLVVLIVLPFSAPFSTCDAASLFASDDLSDDASLTIESAGVAADAGTMHALPVNGAPRPPKPAAATSPSLVPVLLPSEYHAAHDARPVGPAGAQRVLPLRL